jgi:hypothetical protein
MGEYKLLAENGDYLTTEGGDYILLDTPVIWSSSSSSESTSKALLQRMGWVLVLMAVLLSVIQGIIKL